MNQLDGSLNMEPAIDFYKVSIQQWARDLNFYDLILEFLESLAD